MFEFSLCAVAKLMEHKSIDRSFSLFLRFYNSSNYMDLQGEERLAAVERQLVQLLQAVVVFTTISLNSVLCWVMSDLCSGGTV